MHTTETAGMVMGAGLAPPGASQLEAGYVSLLQAVKYMG